MLTRRHLLTRLPWLLPVLSTLNLVPRRHLAPDQVSLHVDCRMDDDGATSWEFSHFIIEPHHRTLTLGESVYFDYDNLTCPPIDGKVSRIELGDDPLGRIQYVTITSTEVSK